MREFSFFLFIIDRDALIIIKIKLEFLFFFSSSSPLKLNLIVFIFIFTFALNFFFYNCFHLLDAVLKFTLAFASVLILRQKSDFLFFICIQTPSAKAREEKTKISKKK